MVIKILLFLVGVFSINKKSSFEHTEREEKCVGMLRKEAKALNSPVGA